jgi:hypothetical protein
VKGISKEEKKERAKHSNNPNPPPRARAYLEMRVEEDKGGVDWSSGRDLNLFPGLVVDRITSRRLVTAHPHRHPKLFKGREALHLVHLDWSTAAPFGGCPGIPSPFLQPNAEAGRLAA